MNNDEDEDVFNSNSRSTIYRRGNEESRIIEGEAEYNKYKPPLDVIPEDIGEDSEYDDDDLTNVKLNINSKISKKNEIDKLKQAMLDIGYFVKDKDGYYDINKDSGIDNIMTLKPLQSIINDQSYKSDLSNEDVNDIKKIYCEYHFNKINNIIKEAIASGAVVEKEKSQYRPAKDNNKETNAYLVNLFKMRSALRHSLKDNKYEESFDELNKDASKNKVNDEKFKQQFRNQKKFNNIKEVYSKEKVQELLEDSKDLGYLEKASDGYHRTEKGTSDKDADYSTSILRMLSSIHSNENVEHCKNELEGFGYDKVLKCLDEFDKKITSELKNHQEKNLREDARFGNQNSSNDESKNSFQGPVIQGTLIKPTNKYRRTYYSMEEVNQVKENIEKNNAFNDKINLNNGNVNEAPKFKKSEENTIL